MLLTDHLLEGAGPVLAGEHDIGHAASFYGPHLLRAEAALPDNASA